MVIRGYTITTRLLAYILGGLLLLALIVGGLSYCDNRRSEAAQSRMDSEQAQAASNSTGEAITTVARSGEARSGIGAANAGQ